MQVSKQILIGAAVVFLGLFGALFYLLGRESTRHRPVAAATAPVSTVAVEAPPVVQAPPLPSAPAAQAPPLPSQAAPSGVVESQPSLAQSPPPKAMNEPLPSLGEHGSVTVVDGASGVREYFQSVDAIQAAGPTGDATEFANKLLASAMNGDTSGLDELVRVTKLGADRARALQPPSCCTAYHGELLSLLGDSTRMVEQIKSALASGDTGALTQLGVSGGSLQRRAEALAAQAKQIKSKYGLR